jgi:hypothetical protein
LQRHGVILHRGPDPVRAPVGAKPAMAAVR